MDSYDYLYEWSKTFVLDTCLSEYNDYSYMYTCSDNEDGDTTEYSIPITKTLYSDGDCSDEYESCDYMDYCYYWDTSTTTTYYNCDYTWDVTDCAYQEVEDTEGCSYYMDYPMNMCGTDYYIDIWYGYNDNDTEWDTTTSSSSSSSSTTMGYYWFYGASKKITCSVDNDGIVSYTEINYEDTDCMIEVGTNDITSFCEDGETCYCNAENGNDGDSDSCNIAKYGWEKTCDNGDEYEYYAFYVLGECVDQKQWMCDDDYLWQNWYEDDECQDSSYNYCTYDDGTDCNINDVDNNDDCGFVNHYGTAYPLDYCYYEESAWESGNCMYNIYIYIYYIYLNIAILRAFSMNFFITINVFVFILTIFVCIYIKYKQIHQNTEKVGCILVKKILMEM